MRPHPIHRVAQEGLCYPTRQDKSRQGRTYDIERMSALRIAVPLKVHTERYCQQRLDRRVEWRSAVSHATASVNPQVVRVKALFLKNRGQSARHSFTPNPNRLLCALATHSSIPGTWHSHLNPLPVTCPGLPKRRITLTYVK